jgi:hypothetical protein
MIDTPPEFAETPDRKSADHNAVMLRAGSGPPCAACRETTLAHNNAS